MKNATTLGILLTLALAACSSARDNAEPVCSEPDCTEAERQAAFDRAVEELGAEGIEITPDSADDPIAYAALGARYQRLTGIAENEQQARYQPDQGYCGPEGALEVNPGDCMNRVCATHDRCYDEIDGYHTACAWSDETDFCDGEFFAGYRACATSFATCGARCHAVAAIALGLKTMCTNPLLNTRLAVRIACAARAIACDDCVGLDTETLCLLRPAQCSTILDGCGRAHDCGTCAAGQTCERDDLEQSTMCTTPPPPPPPPVTCPDGTCGAGETCANCSQDCGICPPPASCPNGTCGAGESCTTCPADCGVCPPPASCPNGTCGAGESCTTCPADCGVCPPPNPCGNGVCGAGETCANCSQDCGTCPPTAVCSNGVCETGETCTSCPQDCGLCPGTCTCTDDDHDSHYATWCTDTACTPRDDCDPDLVSVYAGAPEQCDGLDNDCDVTIDDSEGCWSPVYRFWRTASPLSIRPRCYGTSTTAPAACAGYSLEVPTPVFFVYATPGPGRVEFLAFDKSTDHLLVRAGTSEAIALAATGSGWTLRGSIGYLWADTTSAPPGQYYRPSGAASSTVRELRRYYHPSAGIHLLTNNPSEPVSGWTFEQNRAWVWGSFW